MRWFRCHLCHYPFQGPIGLELTTCERHEADGTLDVGYMREMKESLPNEVCHCRMSTAAAGHIHERGGYILCLHDEEEDGSTCLVGLELNDIPGAILHQY